MNKKFVSIILLMAIVFADFSIINPQKSFANDNGYDVEYNQEENSDVYVDDIQQAVSAPIEAATYAASKSGTWIKSDNGKWWYKHTDGTYTKNDWEYIDGYWYHFDSNGWMQIGWLKVGNYWYHLDENGRMQTGWHKLSDGYYYYFNSSGIRQVGWLQDDGYWYHLDEHGRMQIGWHKLSDGYYYYFNSEGKRQTGWVDDGGESYYLNSDGIMQTGWLKYGFYWYHLDYETGAKAKGWKYIINGWYYFNSEGKRQTGWLNYGEYRYYLDKNGVMQTKWCEISGNWYFFDSSGIMQTGWIYVTNRWFYLEDNGKMRTKKLHQDLRDFWFEEKGDFKGALYRTELDVVREEQKKTNWCWAASASMVGRYNNPTQKTQSDIVSNIKGSSLPNLSGNPADEMTGIKYVSNGNKYGSFRDTITHRADISTVVQYIDNNKPFIINFSSDTGILIDNTLRTSGHAYVCAGYDKKRGTIKIVDPLTAKNAEERKQRIFNVSDRVLYDKFQINYGWNFCTSIVSYEWE